MKKILMRILKAVLLLVFAPLIIANKIASEAFGVYGQLGGILKGKED